MKHRYMIERLKRAYARYDRFMEKQGFGIVLAVCVLIIISSALYTFHFRQKWMQPEPSDEPAAQTVDSQEAQTLLEAQELVRSRQTQQTAVPTVAPFVFKPPVDGFLDRDFSMKEPQYFAVPNYYRLHPGIDLQVDYGTPVKACADGQVIDIRQDNELGLCVKIQHENSYVAVYAGLCDASYFKSGDRVLQGQTIGHAGNGVVPETDAEPHVHLEVWLGDTAVDPVELFLGMTH